jgi:hypothetical protein
MALKARAKENLEVLSSRLSSDSAKPLLKRSIEKLNVWNLEAFVKKGFLGSIEAGRRSHDEAASFDWCAVVHVPAAVDVVVELGAAPIMRPSKKILKTAFSRSASASVSLL